MHIHMNIYTTIIVFLLSVEGLEESTISGDKYIRKTETIIRNTVNKLFYTFNLTKVRDKPRIKEYTTLHKYFLSLTLQDDYNLNRVMEEARASDGNKNNYHNITEFIALINEILDGDNKTNQNGVEDNDVEMYIEKFVTRLKIFKKLYTDKTVYANINSKLLEYFENVKLNKHILGNITEIDEAETHENTTHTDDIETWEPSGRRIYNGERTKIKHFPFVASIHIFNGFHCAGSIIQSDLIITASSCLQLAWNNRLFRENPAFLSVRVGSSFYSGGGESIAVLEIFFHPAYNPKDLKNNICLLRLVRHIKFSRRNKNVKKINIDTNAWSLPLNTPGITILGWGAHGRSGIIFDPWKNILSCAMLDIYPLRECKDIYSRQYVTQKNFCAGFMSKGGGACNRDVGGPGIEDGKLIGVISFGSPTCGTPDAPTVFTKVGYYTDWIETIMEQRPPSKKPKTTLKYEFDPVTKRNDMKLKRTTFKLAPLNNKNNKPLSVIESDNTLRILDDDLFKEFLSTMFSSKEINEYRESLKSQYNTKSTVKYEDKEDGQEEQKSEEAEEAKEPATQIPEYDENISHLDTTTHTYDTRVMEESQSSVSVENQEEMTVPETDIVKFMQDVDLKKIIKEEITTEANIEDESKNYTPMTLLYISEEKDLAEEQIDNEYGLSIPSENFDDMTRSKGKSYGMLPENELYGLLSDVIESEVQNKIVEQKI